MSITTTESATRQTMGDAITAEDITASGVTAPEHVARYALTLADDSLILSQRLCWWISRAPEMEEDIAMANIALDLLGHARFLYTYAGTAWGKTEDDLAYFRGEEEFTSVRLVEMDNGDFGQTIARNFYYSHYAYCLFTALQSSSDATLAAIADKVVKELDYHVDHANQWILRLGLGTEESRRRLTEGLYYMWPYVDELFEDLDVHQGLEGIAPAPSSLKEPTLARIRHILGMANLEIPEVDPARSGHRTGCYSEHRSYILTEMQSLARQHPGATW